MVVDGCLDARDGDQNVGQIRRGEVFGETAFLLQRPRTLDIVASAGTTVLCLSERTLRQAMAANATLAQKLLLNVARTLSTRATAARRCR